MHFQIIPDRVLTDICIRQFSDRILMHFWLIFVTDSFLTYFWQIYVCFLQLLGRTLMTSTKISECFSYRAWKRNIRCSGHGLWGASQPTEQPDAIACRDYCASKGAEYFSYHRSGGEKKCYCKETSERCWEDPTYISGKARLCNKGKANLKYIRVNIQF